MKLLSWFRTLLDYLFCRRHIEGEMEEELRSHLANRADDLVRQGLTREEAVRQARVEFGGYERYKEECREALGSRLLGELIADVRYGLRQLRRSPGFTVVAIITLALGIGANTAIFNVVDAVVLEPLPFRDPGRLVTLWEANSPFGAVPGSLTDLDYVQWKAQNQVFEDIAALQGQTFNLTGANEPERLLGAAVTPNLFRLLGVAPVLGRAFLPQEEKAGQANVVLLSYGLWQRKFAANRNIVGTSITLDGSSYAVVGVLPAGFDFPNQASIWCPLVLTTSQGNAMDQIVARLKP
jgi:MacB-like periplasmic core domain